MLKNEIKNQNYCDIHHYAVFLHVSRVALLLFTSFTLCTLSVGMAEIA